MPKINKAAVSCARSMGGGAIIMSVLSTETPTTGLPKGALFNPVTRIILIAPKAVGEFECGSLVPLAKYFTTL